MKTILVPTDFSGVAENAMNYAIELAKETGAKLLLLHAYHVPVPSMDAPVVTILPEDIEKINRRKLEKVHAGLKNAHGNNLQIEYVVRAGFAVDVILSLIDERKIDLVVMGITGGTRLGEALIGSTTTTLMKRTRTPVLVIPPDTVYKPVRRIAVAYDFDHEIEDRIRRRIREFADFFGAEILIAHVWKMDKPIPVFEGDDRGFAVEQSLSELGESYHIPSDGDIETEINSFIDGHQCNWLVMMPHKHTFLGRLFHKSNAKMMAFHTHVPLLSLHD